jgi:hypothetical protein
MSSLFGSSKSAAPDPNALPPAKQRDESLLAPGADAELDPGAQLQKDQVAANALAAARGVSAVALTAPYLARARATTAQRTAAALEAEQARSNRARQQQQDEGANTA